MTKKDPFAPINLQGKKAEWFVNYLEGKEKMPSSINKRRTEIIQKANKINESEPVCLT